MRASLETVKKIITRGPGKKGTIKFSGLGFGGRGPGGEEEKFAGAATVKGPVAVFNFYRARTDGQRTIIHNHNSNTDSCD